MERAKKRTLLDRKFTMLFRFPSIRNHFVTLLLLWDFTLCRFYWRKNGTFPKYRKHLEHAWWFNKTELTLWALYGVTKRQREKHRTSNDRRVSSINRRLALISPGTFDWAHPNERWRYQGFDWRRINYRWEELIWKGDWRNAPKLVMFSHSLPNLRSLYSNQKYLRRAHQIDKCLFLICNISTHFMPWSKDNEVACSSAVNDWICECLTSRLLSKDARLARSVNFPCAML